MKILSILKRRKARLDPNRVISEKIANDDYLVRVKNSAHGFTGCRHYGDGPFLRTGEINSLIWRELKRVRENITSSLESEK